MSWIIDLAHTHVQFAVKHMMISTVRGRFAKFNGTLVIDEQHPERSSAEGVIETASLDTNEPNRDAHLRSADFFDAENFPTMTFRSTQVAPAGDGEYRVTGDLTIRGITRPLTFTVTDEGQGKDPWGGRRRAFTAQAALNRKDFGLNWNVALETGGLLVGDQVKILIEMEAVEQVAAPVAAPVAEAQQA